MKQAPDHARQDAVRDSHSQTLSLVAMERVHCKCVEFEAALKSGQRPKIETLLRDSSGFEQAELLRELLKLELDYRVRRGEVPQLTEYLGRFTEHEKLIADVIHEAKNRETTENLEHLKVSMTLNDFARAVVQSRLLDQDTTTRLFRQFQGSHPPNEQSARGYATYLIKAGKLTVYQAGRLLMGRTQGFFLGKHKIMDKLGRGAMGQVYLAQNLELENEVALKVLKVEKGQDATHVTRFRREAKAAAKLRHPNIVKVYDVGQEQSIHYIVMELVKGVNLQDYLARVGPLSAMESIQIIRQVAAGLQHAHDQGIIHRDIKPLNLALEGATVKILDFGLAKSAKDIELTQEGVGLGTPDYMSPEQFHDAHRAGVCSDLYSLGCTWFKLLTGHPPFPGDDVHSKSIAHRTQDPPLHELDGRARQEVADIIAKLLAKQPEDRFQSAAELIESVERISAVHVDTKSKLHSPTEIETNPLVGATVPADASQSSEQSLTLTSRPVVPVSTVLLYLLPLMGMLVLGGAYVGLDAYRKRIAETPPNVIEIVQQPAGGGEQLKTPGPPSDTVVPDSSPVADTKPAAGVVEGGLTSQPVTSPPENANMTPDKDRLPEKPIENPVSSPQLSPTDSGPIASEKISAPKRQPQTWPVSNAVEVAAVWEQLEDGDTVEISGEVRLSGPLPILVQKRITLKSAARPRALLVFDVSPGQDSEGLVTVRQGALELTGLDIAVRCNAPVADEQNLVVFQITDSVLRLQSTTVTMWQDVGAKRAACTMVSMTAEERNEAQRPVGDVGHCVLSIEDSLMRGIAPVFATRTPRVEIAVKNSIVCGPGPVGQVTHLPHASQTAVPREIKIQLQQCTVDVIGPVFELLCEPESQEPAPMTFGANACLFANFAGATDNHPPIVHWRSITKSEVISSSIRWTGQGNLYYDRSDGLRANEWTAQGVKSSVFVGAPTDWERLLLGRESDYGVISSRQLPQAGSRAEGDAVRALMKISTVLRQRKADWARYAPRDYNLNSPLLSRYGADASTIPEPRSLRR